MGGLLRLVAIVLLLLSGANAQTPAPSDPPVIPFPLTSAPVSAASIAPVSAAPVIAPVIPPSNAPVVPPSIAPIVPPSNAPVVPPSNAPVVPPSNAPVMPPSNAPVIPLSAAPVILPTDAPVMPPTDAPTTLPITPAPMALATPAPSAFPVVPPTDAPVIAVTPAPVPVTISPVTPVPTSVPTTIPTTVPTPVPTPVPTTASPVLVTVAPTIVLVTAAPTTGPTTSPTPAPTTASPTATPLTPVPTLATAAPVAPVTPGPTVLITAAPVTDAPVTDKPVTAAPSLQPSSGPTVTVAPSLQPSSRPSATEPSRSPSATPSRVPSASPSQSPSASLTQSPSASLTQSPSASPTQSPITPESPPTTPSEPFVGLTMSLRGIQPMSDESLKVWEATTKTYFEDFYATEGNGVASNVVSTYRVTGQTPSFNSRRLASGRFLQQSEVTLTYTQTLLYTPGSSDVTAEQVVETPFVSNERRVVYVGDLKSSGDDAFSTLANVSPVEFPVPPPDDDGLSTGAIIGIAVGGGCAFMLLLFGGYQIYSRSKSRTGYFSDVGEAPPTSIRAGGDEVSRLDEPSKMGVLTSDESLAGYGDQSVATVDYDYSKAYGGGADHSVSSAGGTFGSNPQAFGANQGAVAAGAATLGNFSDDGSFGDGVGGADVREERIEINAPAGKLGVVIDTPDDGAPVVHAIKDSSVIASELQVGDKLVAVDDEDVTTMTAIKVSKLISRKSGNANRKLSIIRLSLVE